MLEPLHVEVDLKQELEDSTPKAASQDLVVKTVLEGLVVVLVLIDTVVEGYPIISNNRMLKGHPDDDGDVESDCKHDHELLIDDAAVDVGLRRSHVVAARRHLVGSWLGLVVVFESVWMCGVLFVVCVFRLVDVGQSRCVECLLLLMLLSTCTML